MEKPAYEKFVTFSLKNPSINTNKNMNMDMDMDGVNVGMDMYI
jgi:hypothetical protein